MHYCSLENKFSGQVYQQNRFLGRGLAQPWHAMSERDYFLKSAKVFGSDVEPTAAALRAVGELGFNRDESRHALEFPLEALPVLTRELPDMEVAVCLSIAEQRERETVLRELAVYRTTPSAFDIERDL